MVDAAEHDEGAISCGQQDYLPALALQPAGLRRDRLPTLTEVATFAIYGTPIGAAALKGLGGRSSPRRSLARSHLSDRAKQFYKVLSEKVSAGNVVLTGIPEYRVSEVHRQRAALPREHQPIGKLETGFVHDLFENELEGFNEANPRPRTEADVFGEIFNTDREARWGAEDKIVWRDVRLSLPHADQLTLGFGGRPSIEENPVSAPEAAVVGHRKPGPRGDRAYIEAHAKKTLPKGMIPEGMSKAEARRQIIASMKEGRSAGQNQRIPSDRTFQRCGY